jgi:hypothetical protein
MQETRALSENNPRQRTRTYIGLRIMKLLYILSIFVGDRPASNSSSASKEIEWQVQLYKTKSERVQVY